MKSFFIYGFRVQFYLLFPIIIFGCSRSVFQKTYVAKVQNFDKSDLESLDSISSIYKAIDESSCSNDRLFLEGIELCKSLIRRTNNPALKEAYKDSVMHLFDARLACFNEDSIDILNQKTYHVYAFYSQNEDRLKWVYDQFSIAFKISGDQFFDQNILPYFDIARKSQIVGNISEEEVLLLYDKLINLIDLKVNSEESNDTLIELKNKLSELLPTGHPISCDFIVNNLLPKLDPRYWNEKLANNILRISFMCEPRDSVLLYQIIDRLEVCGYKKQAIELKESLRTTQ